MAKAYYSTIMEQPAGAVWREIRDFGNYTTWVQEVEDVLIEDDKAGDEVGAVRAVRIGDRWIRQRLLAHSDVERFYSYEFCEPDDSVAAGYTATLRVTPVTDGDRSFVEWWAQFESDPQESRPWIDQYERSFAGWLESLRRHLAGARLCRSS